MPINTINSFISTIDPSRTIVDSFPEFIAIFGGDIRLKKRPTNPKSQREAFYWWVLENRDEIEDLLLLPESYSDWSDFAVYSDLLLFEKDLGYLTSAVLVFLEAPGSIAELGAFSQINSLSERLIVVVTDDNHPKKSFISLGPIRSIEETQRHQYSVCVIPKVKPTQLITHIPIISDTLDQKRECNKVKKKFNSDNPQHQILLILDLINLFSVLKKSDLQQLASHFGIEIKLQRLDQILFLLEKTKLVKCQRYGNNQYYLPDHFKQAYIKYRPAAGAASFKRETVKTLIWEEIQKDKYRKNVLELASKVVSSK